MLLKLGFGANQIAITRLLPVNVKPRGSDQIFYIQTATAAQCRYVCSQNNQCLVVFYDSAGSHCSGYKTDTEGASVGRMKAWKVIHIGLLAVSYYNRCERRGITYCNI